MSSDRQILSALALKTNREMRYFEIVHLVVGASRKKCHACLGKHSIVFMRQDLNDEINSDGELMYAHIVKVVEDTESPEHFLMLLNENASWASDRVQVKSENRELLLQHLQCCWQTDHMWRLHKVARFPRARHALTVKFKLHPEVEAFKGFTWRTHRGYKFMLPAQFVEQANAIQAERTGEYSDKETGVNIAVHVHEVMTMEELNQIHREHIRWVAAEYKANLVKEEHHFYVLRNGSRMKRMNLFGDLAAWYGWEQIIRTRDVIVVCMLLRRQHLPPLCDCAQDVAIILRVPSEYWLQEEVTMILQSGLIADSVNSVATPSIYPELVQAKLDALRFDEDGLEWVGNHVKLISRWRHEAKRFLRSILQLFLAESGNMSHGLPQDILFNRKYLVQPLPDEEWEELAPLYDDDFKSFIGEMLLNGEGLEDKSQGEEAALEKCRNLWLARVARYFAWAVDGGLLGPRFTMDKLIEGIPELQNDKNSDKVDEVLIFLLHMRDVDASQPWVPRKRMKEYMDKGGADRWVFNDRVMQQIISCDYLRKEYGRGKDSEYFGCLASILRSKAGVNLKAYICRIFMEMRTAATAASGKQDDDANVVAVPALLELMETGGLYLATFASAALVNLSHANELVKMHLMSHGMAPIIAKNIQSKDDDLINYTLTLMVNVTKEAHHRHIIANAGMLPLLYDMLTSSYHQCKTGKGGGDGLSSAMLANSMKEKILAHICSIMGHFCKDEEHRDHLVEKFEHTVKCLIYIATHCTPCSTLMAKVMYALKQFCAAKNDVKRYVGAYVLKPLCLEIFMDTEIMKKATPEFMNHMMQLLLMLASYQDNCIRLDEVNMKNLSKALQKVPAIKHLDTFEANLKRLEDLVEEAVNKMYLNAA